MTDNQYCNTVLSFGCCSTCSWHYFSHGKHTFTVFTTDTFYQRSVGQIQFDLFSLWLISCQRFSQNFTKQRAKNGRQADGGDFDSNARSGLVQFVSFLPRAEDRNNPLMLAAVGELLVKLSFILSRWVYCFFFSLSIVITEQKKKMFDNLASILSLETFFDQSSWEKLRFGVSVIKKHNRSVIRSKQAC